jgi:HsdM N-terminal domain
MPATTPPVASPQREVIQNHAAFIWSVADLLRGNYKQSEYGKVILPLTVIRRLDYVLEPTKQAVLDRHKLLADRIENLEPVLQAVAGQQFYNTSPLTFKKLLDDPDTIADSLQLYVGGFSETARDVIDKFDVGIQIGRLRRANLLYKVIGKFAEIDLHPDAVSNIEMGYLYEELIRKFSELSNETAGEQPQHHRPHVAVHRRPAGAATVRHTRPPAAHDVAVPTHDRAGSDDQPHRGEAVDGQRPGQQRQPRPVRPHQTRMNARPLALGDSELMAQHQDLRVLPPRLPPRQTQHRHHTGHDQEISVKPTGRRSSHLRTDQDLPARHPNAGPSQPRSAEHLPRWRRFSAPTPLARITGRRDQSETLTGLVIAIARAGDFDRAEALAATITDPGPLPPGLGWSTLLPRPVTSTALRASPPPSPTAACRLHALRHRFVRIASIGRA